MQAYITDTASFLPNAPVDNDSMERVLGQVYGIPSRTRRLILRNNGIRQRHYAIDPETGRQTHTNAEMTAEAVRCLSAVASSDIECLACGSSSPDQIMPAHASMVHGELGDAPREVISTAGICVSGMSALKYAAMSVASGESLNAVATGSELASNYIRGAYHENRLNAPRADVNIEEHPQLAFEADFLRWMLSDGAGALFLQPNPAEGRRSFRVDWIEILSYADEMEPCMYAGAIKRPDGSLKGWREFDSIGQAAEENCFAIKQDVRLLNSDVIRLTVERGLADTVRRRGIKPEDFDWCLAHYSSDYFRKPVADSMKKIGFEMPFEKWFTNLATKGNTGAASIYIMLDEFRRSERMREGERLLCFIPESGRFSVSYVALTIV